VRDPLQILAVPTRQQILRLCWESERTAGEIAAQCPVTFGATSQHLRVLREAGFVTMRKQGRQRIYRADRQALGPLARMLEDLWASALSRLRTLAEAAASAAATAPRRPRQRPRPDRRTSPRAAKGRGQRPSRSRRERSS
jgi:DNA-binding transcriptional ArsR family regulator